VIKAMLMTKLKMTLGLGAVLGLLFLGGVLSYHTAAAGKAAPTPAKEHLANTLILLDKQWWEAASKHDVDTLGKLLADDWVCGIWTRATSLEHYKQSRHVEVKFLTQRKVIPIDKHTALMSYEVQWHAQTKGKVPPDSWGHDRLIHCWVQRDGGWVIKYTECVNLPVAKEAAQAPVLPPVPKAPEDLPLLPSLPGGKPFPTAWKLGVRASDSWPDGTPEMAFDGKRDTYWNSNYAPQWIEKDLGAVVELASIELIVAQTPAGATVHEVWVSNEPIGHDRGKAKLAHTFAGETANQQSLQFNFPKGLSARYVQIFTTQSPSWVGWYEVDIQLRKPAAAPATP
jgi:hypothetical protein